jgi:hypothetical protein
VYAGAILFIIMGLLAEALVLRLLAGGRLAATAGVTLLTTGSEIAWYGSYHMPRGTPHHVIPVDSLGLGFSIMVASLVFVLGGSFRAGARRRGR